jgi:hypothetical protein
MRYSLEKTRFFLLTPMAVAAIQIAVGIACIALSISIAFPPELETMLSYFWPARAP